MKFRVGVTDDAWFADLPAFRADPDRLLALQESLSGLGAAMPVVSDHVLDELLTFRKERDWEQFHSAKNLSAALAVEVAELLECFQWVKDEDVLGVVTRERSAIEDEIADIAILLSYLCHDLRLDLDDAVQRKIEKNRAKYPLDRARGRSTKYDRL
ncbi:MAG: nucleotide pyrophosphohydrolase [Casimicrobiaceae bacterium]